MASETWSQILSVLLLATCWHQHASLAHTGVTLADRLGLWKKCQRALQTRQSQASQAIAIAIAVRTVKRKEPSGSSEAPLTPLTPLGAMVLCEGKEGLEKDEGQKKQSVDNGQHFRCYLSGRVCAMREAHL